MFLFRRRKDNAESNADGLKLDEIEKLEKSAKPAKSVRPAEKDKKEKTVKKAGPAGPARDPFFQSEDDLQIIENDTPVKVVIPASALIEEDLIDTPVERTAGPAKESVPEDVADGLLVPVNRGNNELEEDISLEAILPPKDNKAAAKATERAPAAAAEKAQPVAGKAAPVEKSVPAASQTQPAAAPKAEVSAEGQNKSAEAPRAAVPAEGQSKNAEAPKPAVTVEGQGKTGDAVKLPGAVDSKPEGGAASKPAAETAKKPEEDKGNLFSQLFGKVEEAEETPLDRLIKALPEISMEEVVNEAEEVKGLMSEWFQNQTK
jgi:hypothetical protein